MAEKDPALEQMSGKIKELEKEIAALRERKEHYKNIFHSMRDVIIIADPDRNIINSNESALRETFGYDFPDIQGQTSRIIYADDESFDMTGKAFFSRRAPVRGTIIEVDFRKKNGDIFRGELCALKLKNRKGRIIGNIGVIRDITDRKKTEEALKKSEEKYQALITYIPSVTWISDRNGGTEFISPNIQKVYGYTQQEIYDSGEKLWFGSIHPDDIDNVRKNYQGLFKKGGHFDIAYRIKRKDGKWIWIHDRAVTTYNKGETQYAYGVFSDITESKQAKEALEESEGKYRTLLETVPHGIQENDLEGNITFSNKAHHDILCYAEGELVGKHIWDVLADESERESLKSYLQYLVKDQPPPIPYVSKCLTRDRREIYMQVDWNYKRNQQRQLTGFISIITDITERRKTEHYLRDYQERMKGILKSAPLVLWSIDANGIFTLSEGKALESLGLKPGEVVGTSLFEMYRDYPDIISGVKRALSGEELMSLVDVNGIAFESWYSPLRNQTQDIVGALGVATDITERKKLEEELQRSHKLESIGILAGGIAHDFNNLLTAIMNNVYLARMNIDRESKAYSILETAEKGLLRAGDLTRQLLTFSKGGAPVKKTTSVIELIRDSADFALRGSNVKCEYHWTDNLWSVDVDTGQMSQVIHNLIINADQAMPDGGIIQVRAENTIFASSAGLPLQEGRYVRITIQDRGTGISEEHLQKIFDPYFSTKEMGRGLGLAITYSIIKNHEGYISVESGLGKGASFTIYLPAADEKQVHPEGAVNDRLFAGRGRILIMDDDEMVRQSLGDMLRADGLNVEFAQDGNEAIEIYKNARESSQTFDCVILDITVPGGMGGKETMETLLKLDPEVKAIVSSGYSNDPVMADFRKFGFKGVIAKPYKVPDLSSILNKVIRGEA